MGDLLTSYDGTAITYDQIGNPLSYYNGSTYTFTWTGRQLTTAIKGSTNMSFTYNDDGIRTSKTVNGVKHTYYLNGSLIVAEQWSDKLIIYLYDASGAPIGMMYRTTSYAVDQWDVFWFEKNLQGDIVAVYNSAGTKVATYNYTDAWGNHSVSYSNGGASTGASYNPFRYRGYYYDTDLGMYYLQSRYYDPNTCRFISSDAVSYLGANEDLISYNLCVYCSNNPIKYTDPTGKETFSLNLSAFLGMLFVDGYSFSIGLSSASDDMLAFQLSYSIPNDNETKNRVYGATASVGVTMQFTILNSVSDLEGEFNCYGINGPISFDVIFDSSNEFVGIAIGVGAGLSFDYHENKTQTFTLGSEFPPLIEIIKDWLGF